jgi:AbrB family looped-hinge helix DNA binding protein
LTLATKRFTIDVIDTHIVRIGMGAGHMSQTKVSSKYQVVIPKEVRTSAGVHVGQKFQVIAKGGIITLVPDKPISSMRGFVRGIRTTGFREKKDRF